MRQARQLPPYIPDMPPSLLLHCSFPISILSPLLHVLSAIPSASPRRAALHVFFPFGPLHLIASICSLCTASRLLLLLLALPLLFLLLPSLASSPFSPPHSRSFLHSSLLPPPSSLHSFSYRLRSVPHPEIRSFFFSFLLLAYPSSPAPPSWSSCSFCFRGVNETPRATKSASERERKRKGERKRERKLRAEGENSLDQRRGGGRGTGGGGGGLKERI